MTGNMMGAGGFDPRASVMGNSMMMGGPGFGQGTNNFNRAYGVDLNPQT
jgi:hypothetical protein